MISTWKGNRRKYVYPNLNPIAQSEANCKKMVCLSLGISSARSGWTYLHLWVRFPVLLAGGPWESSVGGAFTSIAEPEAPLKMTMSDLIFCYNEFVIVTACCQSYQSLLSHCAITECLACHIRKFTCKRTFLCCLI